MMKLLLKIFYFFTINKTRKNRQCFHYTLWCNSVPFVKWHLEDATVTSITPQNFTGHEHYPWFKIINMNGRLYDPVIARFFSPDNFVQMPEYTQGYNRYSYCLNNPLKYVDPTGQLIEYESFRDRWNSFWLRITDEEYRRQFKELKKSENIYVIKYNDDGKNHFSTDGNKLYVNYSLTDKAKEAGQTRLSLLKHEFEHGVQFEHGEIGFEHKAWLKMDQNGNWGEHREWRAVNYDISDELKAHDAAARAPQFKSDNDRGRWLFEYDATGKRQAVPESVRLQRLLTVPEYQRLPQTPMYNTNTEKVKDYYQYSLPYRLRLY